MSVRKSKKQKQQSPQKCPKCGNTENLTVAVKCVPDRKSTWGGRVVWDNDTATTCGACGFIGKVSEFEPVDSYSPENEAAWEEKKRGMARGEEKYFPARCRQPPPDPIQDEAEIKRITDALLRAYPPRSQDNEPKASPGPESEEDLEKRAAGMYGFDIEAERRREAGFLEEIRRRRWTVEAYDDQGNIVATRHAAELSVAVELAKAMEEEYPKVDIITPKGSVFPRWEWRR